MLIHKATKEIGTGTYEDLTRSDEKYLRKVASRNSWRKYLGEMLTWYIPGRIDFCTEVLIKYPENEKTILQYRDKWLKKEFKKMVIDMIETRTN